MNAFYAVGLVSGWVAMACLGGWIAQQKDRAPLEGIALGFLFGPLGVLVEALLPATSSTTWSSGRDEELDEPTPEWMIAADRDRLPMNRVEGWLKELENRHRPK